MKSRSAGSATLILPNSGRETRALITLDQDSGDIRAYPPGDYSGLVVLRLRRQDRRHVQGRVNKLTPEFARECETIMGIVPPGEASG